MNRFRNILFILAFVALSDAHWGVMQLATWVEMTVDSAARNEPVLTSVMETVTGEKKCPKCCHLEQERHDDSERAVQWEMKNLAVNSGGRELLFPPVPPYQAAFFFSETAISRRDAPLPLPPWS